MASFSPRAVLGLVLFGALTFVALLWFIGQGDTGPGPDNGGSHAAGHGLTGYAGLVAMLGKQGYDVSLSRSAGRLDDEALLVLTPPLTGIEANDISEIIDRRRHSGPTLLILPKWLAVPLPPTVSGKRGWVQLVGERSPPWADEFKGALAMQLGLAMPDARSRAWEGLGLRGVLPGKGGIARLEGGAWIPLVRGPDGKTVVAYAGDAGCYPVLDAAADRDAAQPDCDGDRWNVMVAVEPDLFNNYGLADRSRAKVAARIVELAREGQDVPIVFDLTLNGYGASKNLLTLAFAPPFVAATICLLLALVVVGWRAFGRFGPPWAEGRSIAFGKARLAANAAGFIRRSGRLHLLGPPYARLIGRRLAAQLGLRRGDASEIDAALLRRGAGGPSFSDLARQLENARGASGILRAAHALKSLERTIAR